MRILDSTLICSILTQSHQPLLSTLKHLLTVTVSLLLTLRNMLLRATVSPINSNRAVFNSTLQDFSQWIYFRMEIRLSKLSMDSDTKPNPRDKHV